MQIDFSAVFERVNHQGILYKLCSVGIGGPVLSLLTQFLSNRSQYVLVDSCRSMLFNVVSGVPQVSVLDPLLFFLHTSEFFCYADDSTLKAAVPSSGVRVAVIESLNRDLSRVKEWCTLWGMKLNASKTQTVRSIVARFPEQLLRGLVS